MAKPKYVKDFEQYRENTGAYGKLDLELKRYSYEYADVSNPKMLYLKLKKYYMRRKK